MPHKRNVRQTNSSGRRGMKLFPFEVMEEDPRALDRMDIQFRWGNYGIRVLKCHLIRFPPGKVVGFHKHSDFEFHFIPRGKGKVILGDKEFDLRDGLFYLTGPNVSHYQEADHNEAMDELCLHIDIHALEPAPGENGSWGSRLEAEEAEQCISRLYRIPLHPVIDKHNAMRWFLTAYRAWQENQPGLFTTIKQSVIQILLCSVRNYVGGREQSGLPKRDMNAYRYQLAVQFIQDNYAGTITLEDVAEKVCISGRQLQRIFEEQAAVSFREYVENLRLAHVCADLLESRRTVEQIAAEHGFSSSNYLYYVFKKRFGVTPGQYRTHHLSGGKEHHQA